MQIERHGRSMPRQAAAGVAAIDFDPTRVGSKSNFLFEHDLSENQLPLFGIMLERRDGAMEGLRFSSGREAGNR
jgi:hypothetical protein